MAKKPKPKPVNTFQQTVSSFFAGEPFKSYNYRQLAKALGVTDKTGKEALRIILEELTAAETLIELNRGKYKYNPELLEDKILSSTVTGTVDMKSTGKAYIITPDLDEDVYIAPNLTGHALNGDTVRVHLFPLRKDRKIEGEIVEILKRAREQFVGTLQHTGKFAFVVPDDPSVPVDFFVPRENIREAKNGQKVIVRMTDWPQQSKNPFAEVVEVLGQPGDNNVEMQSILANYDYPLKFKPATEKEAERIDTGISEQEIAARRDFRQVWTCTIDPEDAKDFDDALSLRKLDNGLWEVGVHIADVSHYVKEGGAIDEEAYERATSVYLVDRTYPMLPEKLSNNVCSLRPNEDKLCYSTVFELNEKAEIMNEWIGRTVINSNRRYNYEEVQAMIEGGSGDFKEELLTLNRLATKLREERFKKGAISFKSVEVKFILDQNAKPIGTYIKEQKESNMLIEDFMLLANRRVAEKIGKKAPGKKERTFVYRVHDEPNPEKLAKFAEFVGKLGYKMNLGSRKGIVTSFNKLFENVKGKGEENMIETLSVRTMAKAEYSTTNIGHYGLAFPHYTHFTSPIRRYPDLMVHRLLDRYIKGKGSASKDEYEEYCIHCSEMERKAAEAERASIKYKQAEFLSDKIGQSFDGLISGVSKYGLFVEIDGCKCEGLVSLRTMEDDFYYLDEDNYKVVGQHHGKEYMLGSPVKIIVKSVDLQKKQMDFILDTRDGKSKPMSRFMDDLPYERNQRKPDNRGQRKSDNRNRKQGNQNPSGKRKSRRK